MEIKVTMTDPYLATLVAEATDLIQDIETRKASYVKTEVLHRLIIVQKLIENRRKNRGFT